LLVSMGEPIPLKLFLKEPDVSSDTLDRGRVS